VIYRLLFNLVLKRIDAENAHSIASRALRAVGAVPGALRVLRRLLVPRGETLEVHALGMLFPSPLGVAAGVDKDASWFESLGALGFGFVEVGTVTATPQLGNPRPRIERLLSDRAVINSMGFPNPGADVVAKHLMGRSGKTLIGVNIGRTKDVGTGEAGDDYRTSAARLAPCADYLVVNVSSPNTPGLLDMQVTDRLRPLVAEVRAGVRAAQVELPILLKLGPDLTNDELDAIADLALELNLDGLVAVNTTTDTSVLATSAERAARYGYGGISGAPLRARALEVLHRLQARTQGKLVLISVGGIESAADAWERVLAGATLVQAHTGFVYGGPLWPRRINRGLRRLVRKSGHSRLEAVIGSSAIKEDDVMRAPAGNQNGAARSETYDASPSSSAAATLPT
jgi:dihydroorotate dehydrogenase